MPFTKCRVAHCIYDLTALLLPRVLRRLIEECWHPQAMGRPTFSEIIIRLDKIYAHCAKQGSWKESLKIWFVFRRSKRIKYRSVKSRIHTELWTLMLSKKKRIFHSVNEHSFLIGKRREENTAWLKICSALPCVLQEMTWPALHAFFVYISLQTRLLPGKLECC